MELLTYLLKVSACTALFFGFYLLVLRKLTFFRINRFYLLVTLLLSFVIPALQFNVEKAADVRQVSAPVAAPPLPIYAIAQAQAVEVIQMPVARQGIDWFSLIPYAYLSVAAILLGFSTWQLCRLLIYINNHSTRQNGLKLVPKTVGFTNCSFFNYVFIDERNLSGPDLAVLLKHEEVHANQFHSIDKIILMICKAVLWFNPIVYFFDKALEQTHEYEADEMTSLNFGTGAYAKLLLKLAVSGSNMPLIHNFVKSPIKARIKMLYNLKSGNMKKLSYLMVLPVAIGLVWLFSVQVVYAQSVLKSEVLPEDTLKKKALKNKELALPNVKRTDSYFVSADYLEKKAISESALGKTLIGTIKDTYKSKSKFDFDGGKLFQSQGRTYILPRVYLGSQTLNLLKKDSELKVVVSSTGFTKGERFVYIQPKQIFSGDKLVYQMPKPEVYPFLYEANKVRFNDGKISSITSSGNKKIINVIANGYNFKIAINRLQTDFADLKDYQTGDDVRLRFVHEVKTGAKSYSIKDWISISKNIRTFGVRNGILFHKFYKDDGRQKVAHIKTNISSSDNLIANNSKLEYQAMDSVKMSKDKTTIYMYGKAKLLLNKITIEADEIVYNQITREGHAINLLATHPSGVKILGSKGKFAADGQIEIWQNVSGEFRP
ncbi:M56 family metallopeptidase [Pedobacter sp. Leaf176]|uniref:M56 family metallopeptidase n=1 Tax=Pedobacter sp. Leaf176 TaxID=1736286 RepID=UPI00070105F4|nr:M56 family metallopeptidase [Pedobacter sp. Leaf176]KQR69814.1 hypothetical protein ASF92_13995 [Pedobacter sp. Leaf176]